MNPAISISSTLAACAGVIAYGAAYPRSQLFGGTICRTSSARKLAITFDDGPNPACTPQLLDLLSRYDARATFFQIGTFARQCPELVREVAQRGHIIANHSLTHANLFWLSPAAIHAELQQTQDILGSILGAPPPWFRPPYGFRNPWVVKTAAELGMKTIMWTLIPGDWKPQPPDGLIRRMNPIAARAQRNKGNSFAGGDILCLHDGGHRGLNADRSHTVKALEYWLPRWRDAGLEFVTIDEAVRTPAQ